MSQPGRPGESQTLSATAPTPFSFDELSAAGDLDAAPLDAVGASDGVFLGLRRYLPPKPRAVLVFHHGGGAHSGAGYPLLARGLEREFGMACYTPDLRGHGGSGGPRGDTPRPEQLWRDVATMVALARAEHPGRPVFVGGHSSGAGVALNYASWRERTPVDGYVFVAPQLGHRSDTARAPDPQNPRPTFAQVRVAAFVLNAISGGRLLAHARAVRFRYPPELLATDPGMVAFNTVSFANGITPRCPEAQFQALDRPFGLWIGERDEIFDPDRVVAYAMRARGVRDHSQSAIVPRRSHLGILVDVHTWIGPFLDRVLRERGLQLREREALLDSRPAAPDAARNADTRSQP